MRTVFFAIVNRRGLQRTTKTDPTANLRQGEHAIKVVLDVPNSVFAPAIPTATIAVPDAISGPAQAPVVHVGDICEGTFHHRVEEHDEYYECPDCGAVNFGPFEGPHFKPGAM